MMALAQSGSVHMFHFIRDGSWTLTLSRKSSYAIDGDIALPIVNRTTRETSVAVAEHEVLALQSNPYTVLRKSSHPGQPIMCLQ